MHKCIRKVLDQLFWKKQQSELNYDSRTPCKHLLHQDAPSNQHISLSKAEKASTNFPRDLTRRKRDTVYHHASSFHVYTCLIALLPVLDPN
uniref:Ovule protein n=1 Tax=Romanomermis culicivorax TaxID=13658 RepID=A0A915JQD7_ROMCU